MASARKCDRCGALYEPYNGTNGVIPVQIYDGLEPSTTSRAKDLCPECMKLLEKFLDGEDVHLAADERQWRKAEAEVCAFWDCGKCVALERLDCQWCKFFKTTRQVMSESERAKKRIEGLSSEESRYIREKYNLRSAYR